ncbi:Sir2 family NAD-dependent protein deacetylase [Phyllobacterium salinisoli]|uniref:Sir2 family NAD-dependent protein deacetylase n=1 Tax=Phyllobacterium salinisoli TaxID=1899321 RepID=A0A368K1K6_9HYPH|nr:SIR2 family protein [Phyllobacterium salinisoli]RCS22282.1 Sir2 family NAD-dependent protein deacetylase [Phyllobacterium salinisoli]
MDCLLESLARSVRQRHVILFVGAGVSMSVGLPSWQMLTEHMADELGLDQDVIGEGGADYQTIAEYYRLKLGSMDRLRDWMKENWQVSRQKVEASPIHSLIVALDFPIIYTTNYDSNLEVAFEIHGRDYVKVANARDVARAAADVTQIVKFHGDFDDEASLVLAETDYFERLSFDSPLDVKFRSDALGRTVLFIGYSMSDMNIRLLLHRLWSTWHRSGYERDRPASFIFMPDPNPVQEAVLRRWGISVVSEREDHPGRALEVFLSKLKQMVDQG